MNHRRPQQHGNAGRPVYYKPINVPNGTVRQVDIFGVRRSAPYAVPAVAAAKTTVSTYAVQRRHEDKAVAQRATRDELRGMLKQEGLRYGKRRRDDMLAEFAKRDPPRAVAASSSESNTAHLVAVVHDRNHNDDDAKTPPTPPT